MAGQSITFDFLSQGAGTLQQNFKGVGDNAALAAKGARLLSDALERQRKAASVSAGSTLALAKADDILAEAEHGLADGALEAEFALKKQADAAKKAAAETAATEAAAKSAGGGFSALASPMGAAVAAGVVLSPVLVTLGAGLGGLGLAALSVSKNTRLMATELAPVKSELAAFSKSLQPEVLGVFSGGLQIAGHILHDIQPVAAATGKALGGVLSQVDAEFQSGTWQKFFGFMAANAGPDMQLVGNLFVQLAADIPPLLTQLQPLATGFLTDAAAALKLVNAGAQLVAWEHQHAVAVSQNTGLLGKFGHAAEHAFEQMFPGVKAAGELQQALDKAGGSTAATSTEVQGLGTSAGVTAVNIQTLDQAVTGLTSAEDKALSPLLAYTNAVLAQRDDAAKLTTALKGSSDQVGLGSAAQRASFSAAQTYIQDLITTADAAQKSHQGVDAQISSIRNALPMLENVKGGTKAYWQEVQTLVSWLAQLEKIKAIRSVVIVTGSGSWTMSNPKNQSLPGNFPGGTGAARGLYVSTGRPGVDDQLIRAQKGELVVSAPLVASGAVDHLRGKIPGFAAGGIVGNYAGPVGGVQPWAAGNWDATVSQVQTGIAKAIAAGVVAAVKASEASAGAGVAGPGGGAPSANAALAQKMMPAWGSGPEWSAWNYVAMRESGWDQFARNPGSGAYGIPQALPPSKMGAAANPPQSNPAAQISWMIGYIKGRYGDPAGAAAHERSFNWYDQGGLLMPGLSLAANGTGSPEHVIPGGGLAGLLNQLTQILAAIQQLTGIVSGAPGGSSLLGTLGGGTTVPSPAGGGFGLTRGDLGLPPPAAAGSTAAGSTDTSTTTATPAPVTPKGAPRAAPNLSKTAAVKVLTALIGTDIARNRLAAAQQDNALLEWLGVTSHSGTVGSVGQLDHLLLGYRKAKNTTAVHATEQLLRSFGVRDFTPVMTVKGNPAAKAVTARLGQVMKTYIAENDLAGARQDNALLTHLGVSKYTGVIGQIASFDKLLAQYKKRKDSKDAKAVEQILRTMGVKKFDSGGVLPPGLTLAVNNTGRPEIVVPTSGSRGGGAGGDIGARIDQLIALHKQLIQVTAAVPAATGRHVAAGVNGAAADAVFRGRYPGH